MSIRPLQSLLVLVLVGTAVIAAALPAGAHVSVVPRPAPKGGFEILSFSVPNEEQAANTVKVEVTCRRSRRSRR